MKHAIILILIALSLGAAQAQPIVSLGLAVSGANFRYDDFSTYVEVYYAFSQSGVTFSKSETGYLGNVSIHTVFTRDEKNAVPIAKSWNIPVFVKDTAGMPDLRMIGRVNYVLDEGRYKLYIAARDAANPVVNDTMTVPFEVRRFGSVKTQFSDIQLASSLKQIEPDTNNIFYKNTYEVIPNPSGLYGKPVPVLYYYSELYNNTLSKYKLRYEVVTSYGKTIITKTYDKAGGAKSIVEVGAINILKLPSGVYTLHLACTDPAGAVEAAQSAKFYVYNPDVPIDTLAVRRTYAVIGQEFALLTEEELNERFDQARYIAEKEERQVWEQLTGSEAKKKFLTTFWENRDRDQATPVNEFYMDYQSRVAFTNTEFRSAYKPGWKSDRGRVFIIYGAPDAIERDNSGTDAAPFEIWTYDNIEGGVQFVFVDRRNMGLYDLVHSTKQGETSDPSYEHLTR